MRAVNEIAVSIYTVLQLHFFGTLNMGSLKFKTLEIGFNGNCRSSNSMKLRRSKHWHCYFEAMFQRFLFLRRNAPLLLHRYVPLVRNKQEYHSDRDNANEVQSKSVLLSLSAVFVCCKQRKNSSVGNLLYRDKTIRVHVTQQAVTKLPGYGAFF